MKCICLKGIRQARWSRPAFAFAVILLTASLVLAPSDASASEGFDLLASSEQGALNIGESQAGMSRVSDSDLDKEIIRLDYTVPKGSAAGIWTKGYPAELARDAVDIVNVGVKVADAQQVSQILVKVEIKGTAGVQVIPLELEPGWSSVRQPVEWDRIGELAEVVFVVDSTGSVDPAVGHILLDCRFDRLLAMERMGSSIYGRWSAVLAISLLAAFVAWLVTLLSRVGFSRDGRPDLPDSAESGNGQLRSFTVDLAVGVAVVLMIVMAFAIQWIGSKSALEAGYVYLAVALLGGLVGELWKLGQTGKHLTATEAFRDVLATGLLAASASGQSVWQGPVVWSDFLSLSAAGAVVFCLIYHTANAYLLGSAKRHLGAIGGAAMLGFPYVLGLLLALQTDSLRQALAEIVSFGAFSDWPMLQSAIGGSLFLFGFSEFVVNAFSLLTSRRPLRSPLAHLCLLVFALIAVIAPRIADLGSGAIAVPAIAQPLAVVAATVLSQGCLWTLVFMLTGVVLDGMRGGASTTQTISAHGISGLKKGMIFSGILMGLVQVLGLLVAWPAVQTIYGNLPYLTLALAGAVTFPLAKTIIESFDGSHNFFDRAARAYRNPVLYARGIVVGLALAVAIGLALPEQSTGFRMIFGAGAGMVAFAGISLLRDVVLGLQHRGGVRSPRLYLVEGGLGLFIGGALAFYFDASQIPIVLTKFSLYTSLGMDPNAVVEACNTVRTTRPDEFRALLNNWGYVRLSDATGGAKILFNETLIGVSVWGIAAWLFAINRAFLRALFEKTWTPIKQIPTRAGVSDLAEGTIRVMRWGLWMSPVIFTFLRPVGTATWYNQDGAVRTLFSVFNSVTMESGEFYDWSLTVFLWVLAYDAFRILIWLDHMGLRVATLVNLSFLGMDRLDERAARFIGPSAAGRLIPEGVKRFTTWAPLLIPFYLPRGDDWDSVWSESQTIQSASGGILSTLLALPVSQKAGVALGCVVCVSLISCALRASGRRSARRRQRSFRLANRRYAVTAKAGGELNSSLVREGYDVTRRAYEGIDPAGRALFLVDDSESTGGVQWPIAGNYPEELFAKSEIVCDGSTLRLTNETNGIQTTVAIRLPDAAGAVEVWEIELQNMTDSARNIRVVPYLEWVLNDPGADRGHTQYNRLFPEMSYRADLNAVLALHRYTKKLGILAASAPVNGFLTSRVDFIGRAGSIWSARCLETLDFLEPHNTKAYPTFDPIGSLLLDAPLDARGSNSVRLLIGCADDEDEAAGWIQRFLLGHGGDSQRVPGVERSEPPETPDTGGSSLIPRDSTPATQETPPSQRKPLIGHGEILPGTPQPYYKFDHDGRTLRVLTPHTPRPYDHSMSNALGHVLCVTNRGLHSSASVNAQQNRITTDWADTVTRELPAEAFYLYDPDEQQWYSPTYLPLRDKEAAYDVEFGVDGTATFRMQRGDIATELTTYVPPDDPTGVYLLTVTNQGETDKRLRSAPYFQIALADNPENSGTLNVHHDRATGALFFENPRNTFRAGPAFAAMSHPVEVVESKRGRFFGKGRSVAHPLLVEEGERSGGSGDPSTTGDMDDRAQVAAFLTTLNVPAGQSCTVAVLLGQADSRRQAETVIRKFCNVETAMAHLAETRSWWNGLMQTLQVETTDTEFDGYVNWLKYQALAERVWARKGFYQASGAFGFRDQLQDTVNMIWVDPMLARRQILLHGSQQFLEGDVVHWFFQLQDGRTGFACRSHAYDNLLWLGWGTAEYVRMTGDESILDERLSYLAAETPLPPLPAGKHGMGFFPHRSPQEEPLLDHVLRAIDLVFERRTGVHGLPLIGAGDWNDGLDEIGSEGRGESVWLGFFLHYILDNLLAHIERRKGADRKQHYVRKLAGLKDALENMWRGDRYLRAIHDDGTEIGVEGSGIWEIDALTAAWAVMSGINPERGRTVFDTAIRVLERDNVILLGWPALREDSKPYLGRSCRYPEGVRENGMYCHGVQWLIRAARLLSEQFAAAGDEETAKRYRDTTIRLWRKISPISHMTPDEIEIYGGQPNKQSADMLTTFDQGRMIWNGYTGAAGWMLRQACEGVIGATLAGNQVVPPADLDEPRGDMRVRTLKRNLEESPLASQREFDPS